MLAPHIGQRSAWITTTGGVLFTLGALAFVVNLWRTFDAADARHRGKAGGTPTSRSLPTIED
jgi:cbb3-type cytochrome oxidase subunit 1